MTPKYSTLSRILDDLRDEAPTEFKSYHPDPKDLDAMNLARSQAFIHLYLKVICGLVDFHERHEFICDGKYDGGLDAFYIDTGLKKIHMIQSKFRATEENFEKKQIHADELVKMDIALITKGQPKDSNGKEFNSKVLKFQRKLQSIGDIARYDYRIVLLGNVAEKYNDKQIRQLVDGFDYEVFDFQTTYQKLLFPICTGTYYDPSEIKIQINLSKKEQPRLAQGIETSHGPCEITVIYVPTIEIAKMLHQYKNAVLKYNPRNYLSLSQNFVNRKIRSSITDLTSNDFAILNNGLTIHADSVLIAQSTGKENVGQMILTNPQLINGGQTAYTLSHIYETDFPSNRNVFDGKEVMVRVVTLDKGAMGHTHFVEAVSNSTNQQTRIKEADRRSNSDIFIRMQSSIFNQFGYFFERKEGEFFDGLSKKYIEKSTVIDRSDLVRASLAFCGSPSEARSKGETGIFAEMQIKRIFPHPDSYLTAFFASRVYRQLKELEKAKRRMRTGTARYGNAFRYGKFAVVAAVGVQNPKIPQNAEEIDKLATKLTKEVLRRWKEFEKRTIKLRANRDYFGFGTKDFDNYFKGKTVDSDIKSFFGK